MDNKIIWYMKIIKHKISMLFKISCLQTVFLNFFSPRVIRENGFLIVYRNTVISFEKKSKLIIKNGIFEVGGGKPYKAKNASLVRLCKGSTLIAEGNNKLEYNCDVLLASGSTLLLNSCYINRGCNIRANNRVEIGANSLLGAMVVIENGGHEINGIRKSSTEDIIIEDNVWISDRVTLISGAHVGKDSVIGACSVVASELPSKTLSVGIPAKPVKENIVWNY